MMSCCSMLEMIPLPIRSIATSIRFSSSLSTKEASSPVQTKFKALQLPYESTRPKELRRRTGTLFVGPVREVSPDVDWTAVWPVARSFHPEAVKLPLRQGYTEKGPPKFGKECSVELLKIPNFLHLSPVAIKKHCTAIKKFCTSWPQELKSVDVCRKHFPLEVITSDYCRASPSIRDPAARIVTVNLKLSALRLDAHAEDKFLRLVGNRYDPRKKVVTITSDRCPTRKQNLDYIKYLLTALYHESKSVEPWESEKSVDDLEYFDFDRSQNRKSLEALLHWPDKPSSDTDPMTTRCVPQYKTALTTLMNMGEDANTVAKYKRAVADLLGLKTDGK